MGGAPRHTSQMSSFSNLIQDCGFNDIPVIGPVHAWHRGRGSNMVLELLDKGLANLGWLNLLCFSKEHHLISNISDYLPIFFEIKSYTGFKFKRKRPFHYEAIWRQHPHFKKVKRLG